MEIVSGINRDCKDAIGGVNKVYLFSWVKYSRSQIVINDNVLTSFPESNVYEFETIGDVQFNEDTQEEDGGKFYNISLSFKIGNYSDAEKLLKKNVRAVVLDRNGSFRLLGAFNGLFCTKVGKETGSNKSDFNGFKIEFEGKELRESLFFYDLEIITGGDTTDLYASSDLISSTSVLSSATFY